MMRFILEKKILLGLMIFLIVIVGVFSLSRLDVEIMPEIEFDGAIVFVDAGEMAAVEVERNITVPLEQKILEIDGVESVQSTTAIGNATLQIFIDEGRGEDVTKEIQSEVSTLTTSIPGVQDAMTMQMRMGGSDYEFYMDISGGDMDEMTAFAEEVLEPRLEELSEVRDVRLTGIQEYEMVIEFDREKLFSNGLDISQVISIIQVAISDTTLGEFSREDGDSILRLETDFSSVNEMKEVEIPTENGTIQLKDLANISIEPMESSSFVWKDGSKDFIFVEVGRTADVTQIEMAKAIREEINNIREEGLIDGFTLNEVVAQADYVEDSINGITENILIGAIIAILVLIAYLRNIRATLIILISIPTSLLLTFTIIGLMGYSVNMLSLIALGLGVAMMIDSSIVILESIYKKKEQGYKAVDAVVSGTKEVTSALIASLLTTIVVFVPIGLMSGEIGTFMVVISIVVSITLISSLLIAFTLIPALSENFLKLRKRRVKEGKILQFYGDFISWVVRKKRNSIMMVVLFIAMFVGSIFLLFKVPMAVMPDIYNRYTEMMVELEPGISVAEKEETIRIIADTLVEVEDVETSFIIDNGPYFFLLINMTKGDAITREQHEVNEEISRSLRNLIDDHPISSVQSALSLSGGQPVQIQIQGEDFAVLQSLAQDVSDELASVSGIVGITNSMEQTSEQSLVQLDRKAMEDAGISEIQLRSFIQQLFMNMPIGEVTVNDKSIPLAVKWQKGIDTEKDLLDVTLPTIAGEKRLSEFISIETIETPNEIDRLDGERVITVSADIENTDLGTVNRDVLQILDDFSAPNGYTISTGGDLEAQQEFFMEMLMILGIAIFLVYLVMAVQFNNLAHPIIIMSVIPMAFVGVVLGLFATQQELNLMSAMGIVMLVGIVLNNAILLIDRVKQLRKMDYSVNDAIVQAGKDRIRPIFMTTFTTVGGMLPLALADGTTGNYQGPMATAVITGLLFATMITLVLIPAVYRIFHAIGNVFAKLFKKQKQPVIQEVKKPIEMAR